MNPNYDVAIVGGGLAGLSLARQLLLDMPDLNLAVVEKSSFPLPEAALKVGESTVEVGAQYLANKLGLLDHIQSDQLPKYGLRFFFGQGNNHSIETRLELGVSRLFETPSYQFDRGRLENHLAQLVQSMGVDLIAKAAVSDLEVRSEGDHVITLKQAGLTRSIEARWLVDASGRAGLLKRKLGWSQTNDHNVNAVWFRVGHHVKIDDWSRDHEWRQRLDEPGKRWLSTNHLMGPGYWVWLIPLASGCTSIGIVADGEMHDLRTLNSYAKSMAWLKRFEPQCAAELTGSEPLDFLALKHFSHHARRVFSSQRIAVSGEAGAFLDPFYSPGTDFIAISNTMIADLIVRDMSGESIMARASIFDQAYLGLIRSTHVIYQNQYPHFGHHRVMPVKIIWDYLVYWSFVAYIHFRDRWTDLSFLSRNRSQFERLSRISDDLQARFKEWSRDSNHSIEARFINQSDLSLLAELNQRLVTSEPNEDIDQQLVNNVSRLEAIAQDIIGFFEQGQVNGPLAELMRQVAVSPQPSSNAP